MSFSLCIYPSSFHSQDELGSLEFCFLSFNNILIFLSLF
ncbi:hypothetical protein LEP1GSC115_4849 [Leptospira interrogans serovar Australis str. 200703203]|uniref:Uncharacterized protein n=1 Tax=Leptospira interrogans serovar Australis str. 200703203 TaxID=1085541 RepID=N1UFX0_LEPIR|nr:hypothetical protein LEP1GSC115_4849 [Leptospira interrogans serovar Australis str. 200703203]